MTILAWCTIGLLSAAALFGREEKARRAWLDLAGLAGFALAIWVVAQ